MKRSFVYFGIALVLFAILFFKTRGIKDYILANRKLEKLIEENRRLKRENLQLSEEIKKLKKDLRYIEKIAREQYNMIKDNETVIKIKTKEVKK